ncbi:DUF6509 family protein [Bacillus sp. Marseille-P3661]|uniref:DUF6509 family protein n=1 Tax=Bacillus sp. Marseille-P3661 TaxID=1936234 RepID=UPI000C8469F2|nr:DUF6509 family protein [Bacillus sp. Marseille-P3661]
MNITNHTVETLEDPFGILSGERYEFIIDIEIPEDDELFSEKGIYIKLIYAVDEKGAGISSYHLYEKGSDRYIDFALDEDEETMLDAYCKTQLGLS